MLAETEYEAPAEHDEPVEQGFEAPLTLAEFVGSGVGPRAQAPLHPAHERVDENDMASPAA